MTWITLTLASALLWAVVNLIDKYVLTRWVQNPVLPVIVQGTVGVTVGLALLLTPGATRLPLPYLPLALGVGGLEMLVGLLYFRAARLEEISRVVPLFYLTPLFVSIWAAVFLGEVFPSLQYFGVIALVAGAMLISAKRTARLRFSPALGLMVLASLVLSVNAVITKFLVNAVDFRTVFATTRVGHLILLLPLLFGHTPDLVATVKRHGQRVVGVIAAGAGLNLLAVLLITQAYAIGYATFISALVSVQQVFVFLFALALTLISPHLLGEEITRAALVRKLTAILLMIIGGAIITVR